MISGEEWINFKKATCQKPGSKTIILVRLDLKGAPHKILMMKRSAAG
ncbi:MAG: hypothetical protein KBA97_07565 [Methanothrix sp.]|nr:hypothetical protein [Methanothrix sp.]